MPPILSQDRYRYFPNELIKPEEAKKAFYKQMGEGNVKSIASLSENQKFTLDWFVNYLEGNHLVIIKDPTR